MYRVSWECLISGVKSHGDWNNSKEFIQGWVEWGNKEHKGEIKHWLETKQ